MAIDRQIRTQITALYGPDRADAVCADIETLIDRMPAPAVPERYRFGPADVALITYGGSLQQDGQAPLRTLKAFVERHLADVFNTVHILPFYPYSSDDGFSVIDYARVDPALGTWEDVTALGRGVRLMFDFVLNHVSAQSPWVRRFLDGDNDWADLAIVVAPQTDLSRVVRPRTLPLLTPFERCDGQTVHLWTTFSADQVDLNWANPAVLLRMLGVMLDYVRRGAAILRLDAVAYLWKTAGTDCIHRPEAHRVVQLLRTVLDRVAPQVVLITETNVPHAENIAYLGNGRNEAQMVYNFTLPPLLLHSLAEGDATVLSQWAATLKTPSPETTFFNFTASHDGIGVRPLEGILPEAAIDRLVARTLANGGLVSMRDRPGGGQSPYELNITYIDALARPAAADDPLLGTRYMASQSIQYALPGVPATYLLGLLGSRNWLAGVKHKSQARRINRETLRMPAVAAALDDTASFRHAVFNAYRHLIRIRRRQPAFDPQAAAEVVDLGPQLFCLRRRCAAQTLWAVASVSDGPCQACLTGAPATLTDLLDGTCWSREKIRFGPYQYRWLVEC